MLRRSSRSNEREKENLTIVPKGNKTQRCSNEPNYRYDTTTLDSE